MTRSRHVRASLVLAMAATTLATVAGRAAAQSPTTGDVGVIGEPAFSEASGAEPAIGPMFRLAYAGCGGVSAPVVNGTYDQRVVELVNVERYYYGNLPPLKRQSDLDQAARYHSTDMGQDNYFSHDTYDRAGGALVFVCGWSTRVTNYYGAYNALAENIAAGYTSPESVMLGWMNSSGHKANILSTSVREIGAGYYCCGGAYSRYWTQDFGRKNSRYPLIINREAGTTTSDDVSLYLYGNWSEMRLRNDGGTWGGWQTFSNNVAWTLASGLGTHTVSAEMRNSTTTVSAEDTIERVSGTATVTPTSVSTGTPPATSTSGATNTPVPPTATATRTNTPVPPTATATPTNTPIPPSATATRTNTPVPPTATATRTNTPVPPTATATRTNTPVPPTATATRTNTPVPSTATATRTNTPVPPTATATRTNTPVPPTATSTPTNTPVPPTATATRTNTPVPPTATATRTNTPVPPTATSTPTNTPMPPTATATRTNTPQPLVIEVAHDAYTNGSQPAQNFGLLTTLRVNGPTSPVLRSHLKFDVTGVTGTVTSARVRLYVVNDSTGGGEVYAVSNLYSGSGQPWTETGLIWNNQPPLSGSPLDTLGAVSLGTYVELDVTSAVTGNGTYSFAIKSNSTDAVWYSSRQEGSPTARPKLIVVTD